MDNTEKMPLATHAYPSEHPYPVAVRRVHQLEQLLMSGVIVHLHDLTLHTFTPEGMTPLPGGPWVTMLDVMGNSRATHSDDEAAARFTSKMLKRLATARKSGRHGWDTDFCQNDGLARGLIHNLAIGDLVDAAVYAMMLDSRNAPTDTVRNALASHLQPSDPAPIAPTHSAAGAQAKRDAAEAFAQALIAQGWHNPSEACVDGVEELLAALLRAHDQVSQ